MRKGQKHTPESIIKIKKSHENPSPESIESNRLKHLGKKDSDDTREKKRLSHLGEKNAFFGKHHTPETLEKLRAPKSELHRQHLSDAKKGIVPSNIEILKVSRIGATNSDIQREAAKEYNNGLIRSDATKQKIVENRTGKCTGEDNPSWKGGVTPLNHSIRESPKYYAWRDAVFKRDNYTDVETGEKGSEHVLNAHHIKPYYKIIEENHITTFEEAMACEELWDVDNGITMTEKHHHAFHSKTGTPE